MGVLRPVLASNRNVFALERVDVLLKFKEEGTFTRASSAMVWKNKVLTTVGANEPRFETDPLTGRALGLRVEGARTNEIINNTMGGVVLGVIGEGGSLPTGWNKSIHAAMTVDIVGSGLDNGVDYIDLHIHGTGSWVSIYLDGGVSALNTQAWAESMYMSVVEGSTENMTISRLSIQQNGGALSWLYGANFVNDLDSSQQRFVNVETTSASGVTSVRPVLEMLFNNNEVDMVLRLGLPQLEKGSYETTPIRTAGASATRASEIPNLALGDWFNPYEGTILSVVTSFNTTNAWLRAFSFNGVSGDYLRMTINNTYTGTNMYKNGIPQANIDRVWSGYTKTVTAYKGDDFASSQDGSVSFTDAVCELPRMTMLNLGHEGNFNQLDGIIAGLFIYPNRKPNAEIESL